MGFTADFDVLERVIHGDWLLHHPGTISLLL